MNIITKFSEYIKEAVYVGKIGLDDYKFIYDPFSKSAIFDLDTKDIGKVILEIKGDGKVESGEYNNFRIFSPQNIGFDVKIATDKVVYILNKNRLGYKFSISNIVEPKYGLSPYSIISSDKPLKMEKFEQLASSTKSINNMVKKNGGFDQFTF